MSSLGNIMKKEIKEILTPATIAPIILMAVLFGSLGGAISGIEEELSARPTVGLINEDDGRFADLAESIITNQTDVIFESSIISEKERGLEEVDEQGGAALLYIPANFTDNILNESQGTIEVFWIMEGAGVLDSISSGVIEGLLNQINQVISRRLIEQNTTVNATFALNPASSIDTTYFKDQTYSGISPGTIAGILSSQSTFIPLIIMLIIMMSGGTVISSMALEKENKTLETLLTLPVKRVNIVVGKIAASALVGLLLAVIYMIGLGYYMQSFQFGPEASSVGLDLSLSMVDLVIMGALLFVTLLSALALCMFLGTLAKNYKSAQTLTFPVVLLVLIPYFVSIMKDFDTLPSALQAVVFAIPFSHPMMATRNMIFNDYTFIAIGLVYVTLFAIAMIGIVVWIFKTDKIVTGSSLAKKFVNTRRWRR